VTVPDLDSGTSPTAADMQEPWLRLDPRMLLVQPLVELFRALPILVPLVFFGRASNGGPPWSLIGAAIIVGRGCLIWVTTTYRVTAQHVQVRKGLLRRTTRTVPRDRIRTVDITAHPLHRVLGLARVAAGTGRSDRHEDEGITLDALTAAGAERLRELLLHRDNVQPDEVPAGQETAATLLARLDPGWVRFAPFTTSGFVTVLASAGVLWNVINEAHVDPTRVGPGPSIERHLRDAPVVVAATEVALTLLVLVTLASVVGYLLTFWGFRLERQPQGSLHVTRGLLTTRATTIEGRRLRGAELSEPLLLRAVGGARTLAITTGLRVGRGAERGGTVLLPPAPREVALTVAEAVLGNATPVRCRLRKHGVQAVRRRYTRALAGAGLLLALVALGWWAGAISSPSWWAALLAIPVALVLAADRARSLGHAWVDGTLVSRSGSLARRRVMLTTEGVIGCGLRSTWFQRRVGLVTLTATTAAGRQGYHVLDVPVPQAVGLAAAAMPAVVTSFLIAPDSAARMAR
jgi:putative membrane protein